MEPLSHKWFLCLVRRSGSPLASSEWVTDTLKGEGESAKFVVKDTVWQGLRCCICWQSPLYSKAKDHCTESCPFLSSINEMRKHSNYVPITPCHLGLSATSERLPVQLEDLAKEAKKRDKEVQDKLKSLETRLASLEVKTGTKAEPSAALERKKKNSKKEKVKERHGGHSGVQAGEQKGKKKSGSSFFLVILYETLDPTPPWKLIHSREGPPLKE
jgi:hypothetical protein